MKLSLLDMGIVGLLAVLVVVGGCFGVSKPRLPSVEAPAELAAPKGSSAADLAVHYRKLAADFKAKAEVAQDEADRAKREAREAWLWWAGVASIVLGVVAFVLSYAYPLAAFLRIGGWAGIGGGAAMLAIGALNPYIGLLAVVTVVAITLALVTQSGVVRKVLESWKDSASRLDDKARAAADEASLALQKKAPLVKKHIDGLLKGK